MCRSAQGRQATAVCTPQCSGAGRQEETHWSGAKPEDETEIRAALRLRSWTGAGKEVDGAGGVLIMSSIPGREWRTPTRLTAWLMVIALDS